MSGDSSAAHQDHEKNQDISNGYNFGFARSVSPQGFCEVRLRTAHRSQEVLGISIKIKAGEQIQITRFDLNPKLEREERDICRKDLLDIFHLMKLQPELAEGLSQLRNLEIQGKFQSWTIKRSVGK